jgi:hypothetical protein
MAGHDLEPVLPWQIRFFHAGLYTNFIIIQIITLKKVKEKNRFLTAIFVYRKFNKKIVEYPWFAIM